MAPLSFELLIIMNETGEISSVSDQYLTNMQWMLLHSPPYAETGDELHKHGDNDDPHINPDHYRMPSQAQMRGLTAEAVFMILFMTATLLFAVYNVIAFLVKQRRYKKWLVSAFYFFSLAVLFFRICYYATILSFYQFLDDNRALFTKSFKLWKGSDEYNELIYYLQLIGIFFTGAIYLKFALAYIQLASLAQMTLVIRHGAIEIKLLEDSCIKEQEPETCRIKEQEIHLETEGTDDHCKQEIQRMTKRYRFML